VPKNFIYYQMSFSEIIKKFVEATTTSKKLSDAKKKEDVKNLTRFVPGGMSKLKKPLYESLVSNLANYEPNTYRISGVDFVPDDEQIKIIKAPENLNIRIVAGAGTGKTTTISLKIKHLLDTCAFPDNMLILTFNVEACRNLKKMMFKILGIEAKFAIYTIDAYCFKLMNEYGLHEVNEVMGMNTGNISMSEYGIIGRKVLESHAAEISRQYK
jgi:hypothetical protein